MRIARKYSLLRHLLPVCALLSAQRASGFCFAPQLKVSDEFYVSDRVLIGTVIRSRDIIDPADRDSTTGTFYKIRADRILRGNTVSFIRVYSENSTARYPMALHRRYVLFLNHDQEQHWVVDNCGNSTELSKGRVTMSSLEQLPLRHSFIYGDVYQYWQNANKLCGPMQVTIRSADFSKTTEVPANCSFQIDVPPGRYAATLHGPGFRGLSDDLSYKDIYCFDVPAGGSAGIAFRLMDGADQMNRESTTRIDEGYKARCGTGKDLRGPIFIP